jgi:hypothetical protein
MSINKRHGAARAPNTQNTCQGVAKQGFISWRYLHQLCLQALFLPAFWLATPSGRSFPPAVGHELAATRDAMISNDLNDEHLMLI